MKVMIEIPDRIKYGIDTGITKNGSIASQIALNAIKNGVVLSEDTEIVKPFIEDVETVKDLLSQESEDVDADSN